MIPNTLITFLGPHLFLSAQSGNSRSVTKNQKKNPTGNRGAEHIGVPLLAIYL